MNEVADRAAEHLEEAFDEVDSAEARYHLRQSLQYLEMLRQEE